MTLERILDIAEIENPTGIIASMGGQLPNQLALSLSENGLVLLGHQPETIDLAENRSKFSTRLDKLGIDQPEWTAATSKEEIDRFVEKVGFPVLIRPSYVLSGAAMKVAYDRESLDQYLSLATEVNRDHPVVITEFFLGVREIELDGVAKDGEILTSIVSEHVENAGVHSGDATTVVPAQKLYVETIRQIRRAGRLIAKELKLNGPFNIQFLARKNKIKVIECNARAARSFPFVSKVCGINLADIATEISIGKMPQIQRINEDDLPYVGVKAAMFSFPRLAGADPVLGVEMASTGEVGCIADTFEEALLLALESAHLKPPKKGVLVSAGPEAEKMKFLESMKLFQEHNVPIYATKGTAKFFSERGIKLTALNWPDEKENNVIQAIQEGRVDFVINIPKNLKHEELNYGANIRQTAVKFGCSLMTDIEKANAFLESFYLNHDFLRQHKVQPLSDYC